MYGSRSWTKDLMGALGAVATGYGAATMAKATDKPLTTALVATGLGVGGVAAKNMPRSPLWHEFLEGVGYGGLGYFGTWTAANTPTIGGKPAGPVPLQDLASTSGAGAAIAAARARAAASRSAGASFPPVTTTPPLQAYRRTSDLTEAV